MSEMNERVKRLRGALSLTQEAFGQRLGLTKSGISAIESGARSVTEKHVLLMTNAFGARASWLKTGEGEMFARAGEAALELLKQEYGTDETTRAVINAYVGLTDSQKRAVKEFARSIGREIYTNG